MNCSGHNNLVSIEHGYFGNLIPLLHPDTQPGVNLLPPGTRMDRILHQCFSLIGVSTALFLIPGEDGEFHRSYTTL